MSELERVYREMAEHTRPECMACPRPGGCCEALYCEAALIWAELKYGLELERTDHPTLPLMGPEGCTAAPHLRPLCTLHTCAIGALGEKPGDRPWTERYFALREEINRLEAENFVEGD